jgi:hypothetical protein
MAFGDCPDDAALRQAWGRFCDRLREAGEQVFKETNPANPLQRADAFRFLTQNLGQAFDLALETRDTRYPMLHAFCTPTCKLGGDAADFTYRQAWIDGHHVYRISGNTGTARFLNFTLQGPRPATQPGTGFPSLHEPFGDVPEANLFRQQLETTAEGDFELWLGGEKRAANWLPTTPGTRKLFIRQGFDSWDETPARLSIERVGMETPRPLPTPGIMIESMAWAGDFLGGMMRDWPDHPYRYSGGVVDPSCVNRFPPQGSAGGADDARRGRLAAHMCWSLAPDEALIVEFDAHDGFWMVSLGGAFMNSLDYLYRPVSYTPARTRVDSDGKVRLILAHKDPGYHNWLDTQGFAAGNLTYRNLMSSTAATFRTRLLRHADLDAALPADSTRLTPGARVAGMRARFDGIRRRYGL